MRHLSLPSHLSPAELAEYIRKSAVQVFKDTKKRFFTQEQVVDFEHESSGNGREMNRLATILKTVTDHINKGSEEPMTIELPITQGKKNLDTFRKQNDDLVEKGFEEIEFDVFGIPNQINETIEFFDAEGELYEDRTRPMSEKEKRQYLGTMRMAGRPGARLVIDESLPTAVNQ